MCEVRLCNSAFAVTPPTYPLGKREENGKTENLRHKGLEVERDERGDNDAQ